MKKLFIFILALSLFLVSCSDNVAEESRAEVVNSETDTIEEEYKEIDGVKYKLTFIDNFDGDTLDTNKWSLCPEFPRQNMGGYWDDSMTSLDGKGNLVLSADISDDGTLISGAIRSKGKFEQAKGYFEIRCIIQKARTVWSSFWLMCEGANGYGFGILDGAEIDVFEGFDMNRGLINHGMHWDGYGEHHKAIGRIVEAANCYDNEYHTYSLLWTDTAYIFYIDGVESTRIEEGDEEYPGLTEVPSYLKVTLEFVSEGLGAAKDYDPSQLPATLVVDYVKAYSAE